MKKLFCLLAIVTMAFAACNRTSEEVSDEQAQKADINPENVVLIDMDVEGMTCTGCENTIKTGVSDLEGVVEVEASHVNAKTFVKVDTSLTSPEAISEKISSSGYKVQSTTILKEDTP